MKTRRLGYGRFEVPAPRVMTLASAVLIVVAPATSCRSATASTGAPQSSATQAESAPSITAANEGTPSVSATNDPTTDKADLVNAHRAMYRGMLAARSDLLSPLLDDGYTLTHMTGRVQSKREWLQAVESREMRYHAAEEKSVAVEVTGDTAVLVGRNVVTATIYGAHGTWNLQLTTSYARQNGKWMAMRTVATTF